MPALLTARHWPQTLLLTILFLMVAVTTALLACGPVAQPTPADDGALLAAQTNGGGEPTAEPAEPAITPTLERENPATPDNTPTPSQTPMQTDSRFDSDLDPPPPKPTRKYPNIGNPSLHHKVIEFEKAQQTNGEASGQEAGTADNSELVELELTHNAVGIAAWLKERGISPSHPYDRPVNADDLYIAVIVPLELLGELSQQEGVRKIWSPNPRVPASHNPPP